MSIDSESNKEVVFHLECGTISVEDFEESNQAVVSNRLGEGKDEEETHKTNS